MRAVTATAALTVGVVGLTAAVALGALVRAQGQAQTATKTQTAATVQAPKPPGILIERQGDGRPNIEMPRQGRGQGRGSYRPAMGGGPLLGIEIRDVRGEDIAAGQTGAVIVAVTKASAAEKAGLKANDVVVSYDGEGVRSARQLVRLVQETATGRTVKIAVMRDGKRMEVEATPSQAGDRITSSPR